MIYLASVVIQIQVQLGPILMTNLRLILIVMMVPMAARLFSGNFGKVNLVDILFISHSMWMLVAIGVNNPTRAIESVGSTSVEFLGGYLLGRTYIRDKETFIATIKFIITMVIFSLPFAIQEALTGVALIPKLISSIPGLDSVNQVDIAKRMGLERVQNTFAHPIHYGLFVSSAVSFSLIGLKGVIRESRRIFSIITAAVCIFLSLSSGALLSGVLQAGLCAWAWVFRNVKTRWWIFMGLLAVAYVAVDLMSNRSPIKVLMSYATFSTHNAYYRSIIFEWGMMNVWQNPIFGLGFRDWIRPWYMRSGTMDNFWLVMAVRYGIPGFLLIASGYLFALIKVGRRDLSADPVIVRLRLAWMITFLGLSFTLCTVHIWTSAYSYVFFLLGAGLWMADTQINTLAVAQAPQESLRPPVRYSRGFSPASATRTVAQKSENGQSRGEIRFSRFPTSDT